LEEREGRRGKRMGGEGSQKGVGKKGKGKEGKRKGERG